MKSSPMEYSIHKSRYLILFFIDIYRKCISPFTSPACRFYPTCSSYAHQAIFKYGVLKGGLLAIMRVLKCHPFHSGGYDPLV